MFCACSRDSKYGDKRHLSVVIRNFRMHSSVSSLTFHVFVSLFVQTNIIVLKHTKLHYVPLKAHNLTHS
jgi:hypothetical protein